MKFKHCIALVICFAFLFLISAGCADTESDEIPEEDIVEQDDVVEDHEHSEFCGHSIDFEAAMAAFPPETVMISSGDLEITWADLYVFLFRTVLELVNIYGVEIEWGDDIGNLTVADIVIDTATEEATTFLTYMYGIEELNIVLSTADLVAFNEDIDAISEMYGGKDEFETSLRENGGFSSFEVFEKLYKIEFSVVNIVDKLYGEDAVDFPDEGAEKYAQENGYMMALHILRLKAEDDEDETPFEEAEDILAELEAQVDSDDFIDFFKELMEEHSEDHGGMMSFPDGYLFQHEDMVPEFSDACADLEEGELSGIVETVYGYHVLLRIPIDFDAVPIAVANQGVSRTLRQLAAVGDFEGVREKWRESLNLEFSPEFNSIDLAKIFTSN